MTAAISIADHEARLDNHETRIDALETAEGVTRTGTVALASAQAWADLGAVIAIDASTTTFFELSIQAAWPDLDGGLALGGPDSQSATVQLAVTRNAGTGITLEQRDGGTEWTFETALDGVPTTVVQVRAQDGGSGTWKLQVRRGSTSAATSVATITAAVRTLSTQAWGGDTATTWIDPDGDATHAPALARITELEAPSQTVHTADGSLVWGGVHVLTSVADGMTIPDVATNAGEYMVVVNAMAATTAVLTRSGSDVVVNGTSATAYNLPAGETVVLRAASTGTNVYVEHGGSGGAASVVTNAANGLAPAQSVTALTAATSTAVADTLGRVNTVGPSVTTINLPAAAVGDKIKLRLVGNSNDIALTPNGADTLNGGATYTIYGSGNPRARVDLECVAAGSWSVDGGLPSLPAYVDTERVLISHPAASAAANAGDGWHPQDAGTGAYDGAEFLFQAGAAGGTANHPGSFRFLMGLEATDLYAGAVDIQGQTAGPTTTSRLKFRPYDGGIDLTHPGGYCRISTGGVTGRWLWNISGIWQMFCNSAYVSAGASIDLIATQTHVTGQLYVQGNYLQLGATVDRRTAANAFILTETVAAAMVYDYQPSTATTTSVTIKLGDAGTHLVTYGWQVNGTDRMRFAGTTNAKAKLALDQTSIQQAPGAVGGTGTFNQSLKVGNFIDLGTLAAATAVTFTDLPSADTPAAAMAFIVQANCNGQTLTFSGASWPTAPTGLDATAFATAISTQGKVTLYMHCDSAGTIFVDFWSARA